MGNFKLEGDRVVLSCPVCGKVSDHDFSTWEPPFLEELGMYENPWVECPECKAVTILNFGIPEFDEDEIEVLEEIAPPEEVENRRVIRDLMWRKRPDLKGKNRAAEVRRVQREKKAEIEKIRAEIAGRKKERGTKK